MLAASNASVDIINFLLGIESKKVLDLVLEWKNNHEVSELYTKQWKNCWNTVDIDARDKNKNMALMYSVKKGHYEAVKTLIEAGANVNTRNLDDFTPLIEAIQLNYSDIVKWLLDAGTDVNAISKIERKYDYGYYYQGGHSPLISAIKNSRANTVKWLIKAEADVSICDYYGRTALQIAIDIGFKQIAEMLKKVSNPSKTKI